MTPGMQRVVTAMQAGATLTYHPSTFHMPRVMLRGTMTRRIQLKTFDRLRRENVIEPKPTEKKLHSWDAKEYRLKKV